MIGGKALASLVVGLVSTVLLVLATTWLLQAEWGDPLGVALLIVGGVLAAVGVTALVATYAKTTAQAGAMVSIVAVVGGLLGGTFFPISQAGLLGSVRFLSPQGWLMEGFQKLAYGANRCVTSSGRSSVSFTIAFVTGALAWASVEADGGGMSLRKALAIAGTNLRRLVKDRTGCVLRLRLPVPDHPGDRSCVRVRVHARSSA